jgi:hypothetical protein
MASIARLRGRKASQGQRSGRVTDHGALGSENADISNDKAGLIPARLNPKDSWGRFVLPGLVGC